jgi:hypothetical protein
VSYGARPGRIKSYQLDGGDMSLSQSHVAWLDEDMKDGRLDDMKQELDTIDATIKSKVGANQS